MFGSALLTIPFGLWTLSQDTLDGFVYAFFGMNFVKGMFYPCCMASVADIMPPLKRGIAVAMMNLSFTIIGQGITHQFRLMPKDFFTDGAYFLPTDKRKSGKSCK